MSQIVNGLLLGQSVYIFRDAGPPSSSTDATVQSAAVGSLYLRTDGTPGATFYVLLSTGWSAVA